MKKHTDGFNRKIEYLRLSVTDRCNIRCQYCMPAEGVGHFLRSDILSFEEITRLVRILAQLGISRVRITGGEPLARKDIASLVKMITAIPEIDEVLLTTNGTALEPLAEKLKSAGLKRINIHLDTVSAEKYALITRRDEIQQVFDGIAEAQRVGLSPIKLNAVMQLGVNDEEVEALLAFAAANNLILRLIELMPIGPARFMMAKRFISVGEIRAQLEKKYSLSPLDHYFGSGPAVYYWVKELRATIGFISPVSQPFCQTCNRIRISSDGRFQDCLAFDGRFSLRERLRDPQITDEAIAEDVLRLFQGKRESHNGFVNEEKIQTPCMSGIGG